MFPKTYINTPASRAHIHPTTRQNNAVHELVLHDTKHIPCLIVQPRVATCPPVSSQLLTIGLNLLSLFFAEKNHPKAESVGYLERYDSACTYGITATFSLLTKEGLPKALPFHFLL